MEREFRSRFVLLFELVENAGLVKSRADMAARLGYRPQAFNEILKGRTNVGLDLIQKFCIEFGANPEYLVLGTGAYFSNKNLSLNSQVKENKLYQPKQPIFDDDCSAELCMQCIEKERIITVLQKVINTQDSQIATQQEMIRMLNNRKME